MIRRYPRIASEYAVIREQSPTYQGWSESLQLILFAEGAPGFDEIPLNHAVDQLNVQVPDVWPHSFPQARFLSAVDCVQADRLQRKVAEEMARVFSEVDLLL